MKRGVIFLSVMAAVICTLVFFPGFTSAFFFDRDTGDGGAASAGYLEVSMEAELTGLGIPGSTLKFGNVKVSNNSPADMIYEFKLTADADTFRLLDPDKGAIILTDGGNRLNTVLKMDLGSGSITLLYYGELNAGSPAHLFDIELAFKGETLIDGNDYQNAPILISHEVIAYQSGSEAFNRDASGRW